jgi:ABC-type Zn uptake system ZnuABC Zn-binding protein ZnuA
MRRLTPGLLLATLLAAALPGSELRVIASVPDLADLVRQVGGDVVTVEVLARPGDNPHFITARPSFIRKLADADAFVVIGMELEIGWAPALLRSARNRQIQAGQPGHIDCSAAIRPLELPSGPIDRSMGDVHPHGNPHYLLSPVNGILVLGLLGERLAQLAPTQAEAFRARAAEAAQRLAIALYGEPLVERVGLPELLAWHQDGRLEAELAQRELVDQVGGWLGELWPQRGSRLVDDHNQWPYFCHCYGLTVAMHLEPKAGIPPSSAHLEAVIGSIREQDIRAILAAPWFDPRHARIVTQATGASLVPMAHQVGSRPGTDGYTELCAHNVRVLAAALAASAEAE